ncbi:hypothetical protein C8R46DRAFT_1186805 [Mycena filopes]|nr:hypothetical protein C8R46DRAFT_1186805 [Mycena filopes]
MRITLLIVTFLSTAVVSLPMTDDVEVKFSDDGVHHNDSVSASIRIPSTSLASLWSAQSATPEQRSAQIGTVGGSNTDSDRSTSIRPSAASATSSMTKSGPILGGGSLGVTPPTARTSLGSLDTTIQSATPAPFGTSEGSESTNSDRSPPIKSSASETGSMTKSDSLGLISAQSTTLTPSGTSHLTATAQRPQGSQNPTCPGQIGGKEL